MIIAHRGASYDAPENTLAAINLAWNQGIPAVEIDIRQTKDKQIVVFHDANTRRITGLNKKVSQLTLKELKRLDAGLRKGARWANEPIPTLEEVLSSMPEGVKLIIELKDGKEMLLPLQGLLKQCKTAIGEFELISFNHPLLAQAKKMLPECKMLALFNLDYYWLGRFFSPSTEKIIRHTKHMGLEGIDVWAGHRLNQDFMDKLKAAKLLVYTWTVNDPVQAKSLLDMGVDGITTDRPQWIRQQMAI